MTQQVQLEDGSTHEFPDEATPAMMAEVLGVQPAHATDAPFDPTHGTELALGDVARGVAGAAPRIVDATDRVVPWAYNTFRPDSVDPVPYPPSLNGIVQDALTNAGLPTPQNATERITSGAIQNIPFGPAGVLGGAAGAGIQELPYGQKNINVAGRDVGISPNDLAATGANMLSMGALSPKPLAMGDVAKSEAGRLAKIDMQNGIPVYPTDVLPENSVIGSGLNFINNTPFSGKQGRAAAQDTALTAAANKTMGEDGDVISPPVLNKAFTRLGQGYEDFSKKYDVSPAASSQLLGDLVNYQTNQMRFLSGDNVNRVTEHIRDITDAIDPNGTISGGRWQSLQSELGRKARSTADPEYEQSLYDLQGKMRGAMRSSIAPDDMGEFDTLNSQYRAALALEKASKAAIGTGVAKPQALETGVSKIYPNYASNDPNPLPQLTQGAQLLKQSKGNTRDFSTNMRYTPGDVGQVASWAASPLGALLNRTLNTRITPMDLAHPYGAAAYRGLLGASATPQQGHKRGGLFRSVPDDFRAR